ncbi:nuclear transport factor 2 family protein [Microvirga arabica]|nr:nuclear transport factor 2 family protein [Microvirga arabica]MBM1174778.1 nuclear transport factor 2 family protein [Microvirga arabica]
MNESDLSDLFDAFNRHDVDAVMAYFADDCVFDAVSGAEVYGTRFIGVEAIAGAFSGVWATMPDAHWDHHGHLVCGDRAVSEWTFTGTNRDGSRVEAQGADLFRLRDGRIIHKQAFRKSRPLLAG